MKLADDAAACVWQATRGVWSWRYPGSVGVGCRERTKDIEAQGGTDRHETHGED